MKLQLTSRVQTIVLGGGLERTRHSKYTSSPSLMLDAFKLRPKRSSARGASEIFQQIMNNSTEKTQCLKINPKLSFITIFVGERSEYTFDVREYEATKAVWLSCTQSVRD